MHEIITCDKTYDPGHRYKKTGPRVLETYGINPLYACHERVNNDLLHVSSSHNADQELELKKRGNNEEKGDLQKKKKKKNWQDGHGLEADVPKSA